VWCVYFTYYGYDMCIIYIYIIRVRYEDTGGGGRFPKPIIISDSESDSHRFRRFFPFFFFRLFFSPRVHFRGNDQLDVYTSLSIHMYLYAHCTGTHRVSKGLTMFYSVFDVFGSFLNATPPAALHLHYRTRAYALRRRATVQFFNGNRFTCTKCISTLIVNSIPQRNSYEKKSGYYCIHTLVMIKK
jgi:hypothetical protein